MKVSIIGAGAVGATTAFTLAKTSFVDEIAIVDIDQNRAKGNALDILHGLSLMHETRIVSGDYDCAINSDVIVITVGVPEKVGESRLVPLQKNVKILQDIIPKITSTRPNGLLLVVSNPVDIISYFSQKISGWEAKRVIGLGTTLDSARLNYLIARDLKISQTDIQGLVIGEHGDSQVVAWSQTSVKGTPFLDYVKSNNISLQEDYCNNLAQEVKDTAFDVWDMKGPNCYCVALAIERVIKAIARNEHAILPVSQPADSEMYISQPHIIGRDGVQRRVILSYDTQELNAFDTSYQSLQDIVKQIEI